MLNQLNWQSLEKQRDDLTLLMFYKIIHQHVDVPCDHILQKPFNFTWSGNRKFLHLSARIDSLNILFPQSHQIMESPTISHCRN